MKIKSVQLWRGILFASLIMGSLWPVSWAENLGVWGETWPIIEPDFLTFIQDRLQQLQQSGQLAAFLEKGKQQAQQALLNPPPTDLPISHQDKIDYYRPMMLLDHDVWLNASTHYAAGTRVYPLDVMTLHETLIIVDGRSEKQLAFAQCEARHYPYVKIILTGGNILHAIKKLGRVYDDQHGMITSRLPISATPVVVNQVGHQLQIHQFNSRALSRACVVNGTKF